MLFQVLFKNDFFFKLTSDRHIKIVGLGGVILGYAVSMTSQSVLHMRKSISTSCKITFVCEQEVQMGKIKEKTKTGALTLYTLSLIPEVLLCSLGVITKLLLDASQAYVCNLRVTYTVGKYYWQAFIQPASTLHG